MAINGKRLLFWGILSFGLLAGVAALFAGYGVRPVGMGGTGETTAYACFLSILYILDCLCLCLIGGMKRQPAFPAALAVITGLLLAFPGWWGAPFYGIALNFSSGIGILRLLGSGVLILGILCFWAGGILREKRGCGEPLRIPKVPSLLDEEDEE
ncbi:MAG: hypothetical protein ACOX6P_07585 [Candidatus Merdivicinus sp.]|jgi:hypothetical protein